MQIPEKEFECKPNFPKKGSISSNLNGSAAQLECTHIEYAWAPIADMELSFRPTEFPRL